MSFYKIIKNDQIIEIAENPTWVKKARNGVTIRCEVKEAHGIMSPVNGVIYQIDGAPIISPEYDAVGVADINENEYRELSTLLDLGATISDRVSVVEWPTEPDVVEEVDDNLLHAIERKVEILSEACQVEIVGGVDVALSNGNIKHFALTVEDQINLMFAKEAAASGDTWGVLFKASGEDLTVYSAEDLALVSKAAAKHIAKQRAYFESLRKWVRQSKTIIEVGGHYYGEDVPEEFWSEAYKAMM